MTHPGRATPRTHHTSTTWVSQAIRRWHAQIASSGFGVRWANAITAGGVLAVIAIAIFDVSSDTPFSHAFLYLIPVVAVIMLSSSRRGVLLAGFAVVSWIGADAAEPGPYTVSGFVKNQLPEFLAFVAIIFLLATLRDALGEAHAADLRSRAFLSDAAHQLRTPAASLQASAETLIMSAPGDDREPMLLLVASEAQRMSRLTNALLQIARLDQGEATVPRPVDIARVCATEVDLVRHRLSPDAMVTLDVDLDPEGPVSIDADATREALANVLDNARRHAQRFIAVAVRRRSDDLMITVTDDGPGLTHDGEDRAFERFTSLDGHGGSGLGLPIARAYVEVQGGTLTYEAGTFVIRLSL